MHDITHNINNEALSESPTGYPNEFREQPGYIITAVLDGILSVLEKSSYTLSFSCPVGPTDCLVSLVPLNQAEEHMTLLLGTRYPFLFHLVCRDRLAHPGNFMVAAVSSCTGLFQLPTPPLHRPYSNSPYCCTTSLLCLSLYITTVLQQNEN